VSSTQHIRSSETQDDPASSTAQRLAQMEAGIAELSARLQALQARVDQLESAS
jgi:uncharacterized protein YceH (UPF0502 family)